MATATLTVQVPLPTLYLPRSFSPEQDQQLQQQLRHADDLESNALLLIRSTGVRIGECVDLSLDCLRQVRISGRFMFHWASSIPNARCPPTKPPGAFSIAFFRCALCFVPLSRRNLQATCSHVAAAAVTLGLRFSAKT